MKTINVSDQQASIIAKQEPGDEMLFPVMMVQPPDGYEFQYIDNQYKVAVFLNDIERNQRTIKIPYSKGTILDIRETWGKLYAKPHLVDFVYVYKADYDGSCLPYFHSSATMPKEAIRSQYEVIGNEVKRVQDVTVQEMYDLGIYDDIYPDVDITPDLARWFNSRFTKKVITWDDNPYIFLMKGVKL